MFKNKTEQNRNDEKYNQTGITVKIHSNHDGFWANTIMLKSIAAQSSWRSPVITASLKNYIGRPSSEKIRACSDILSDTWVEGHTSHCSRVLWRCHPERSSSSGEFGCLSFIKHMPWTLCFLLVMWKNLRVFMSHNSAEVHWTFHFQILYFLVDSYRHFGRFICPTVTNGKHSSIHPRSHFFSAGDEKT